MITREQLKQKYEAIHEHFNFRDFLGLSALVFGLLLSNSSLEPVTAKAEEAPAPTSIEKSKDRPIKKASKKKVSKKKKKVLKATKKRQQITAAHKK